MSRKLLRSVLINLRLIDCRDEVAAYQIGKVVRAIEEHLNETRALARHDSPDTSKAAASLVSLTKLEAMVLDAIASYGPPGCISDEIRRKYPTIPYSSITARFAALMDRGLIEDTGQRRKGGSSRMQRVVRLSTAAHR